MSKDLKVRLLGVSLTIAVTSYRNLKYQLNLSGLGFLIGKMRLVMTEFSPMSARAVAGMQMLATARRSMGMLPLSPLPEFALFGKRSCALFNLSIPIFLRVLPQKKVLPNAC